MSQPADRQFDSPECSARSEEGRDGEPRKRYSAPAIRAYGTLVELTRFGGSQLLDSGSNLQNP